MFNKKNTRHESDSYLHNSEKKTQGKNKIPKTHTCIHAQTTI